MNLPMEGVTFLGDADPSDEFDVEEYIDEPFFVTDVHDSVTSPLVHLEHIIQSDAPLLDRFKAFQSMCRSPYIGRNERCTRILLDVLADLRFTAEERFSWLTQLKLSSDILDVCLYGYVYWFYTYDTPLLYKLMSAQFLLTHPVDSYPFMKTHMKFSQQWLYQLAKRDTEDIQTRSEAADILIRLGTPNFRRVAHEIIERLGHLYVEKRMRTIYSNSQNVHDIINIRPMIDSLVHHTTPLTVSLDDILHWLHDKHADATESFQRIILDTAMYHGYRMTDILRHVYQRAMASDHADDIKQRLVEELLDMKGWCSTGHIVRLLNTLQGFDPFIQLALSAKDEIAAAVNSRLSKHMRSVSDVLKDELIEEMTRPEKLLLEEFVETYSVYDELRDEYKDVLSTETFNAYYHGAIDRFMGK